MGGDGGMVGSCVALRKSEAAAAYAETGESAYFSAREIGKGGGRWFDGAGA